MLLEGKVAVVTGGGRGIGRAIARRFASEGAAVLIASRTEAEIRGVVSEIEQAGGRAAGVVADVSREADCSHLLAAAQERLGPVDILVNNAGEYGPVKPLEEIIPAEFDGVIAVHLRGAFLLMRLVLPGMYAHGSGVIINISSLSAKAAFPWGAPYAAAKAGIEALTRTIAIDHAREGIRAICVLPGATDTPLMWQSTPPAEIARARREAAEEVPLGWIAKPRHVAQVVAFALSPEAAFVTGTSIVVDGGLLARVAAEH